MKLKVAEINDLVVSHAKPKLRAGESQLLEAIEAYEARVAEMLKMQELMDEARAQIDVAISSLDLCQKDITLYYHQQTQEPTYVDVAQNAVGAVEEPMTNKPFDS